MNAFTSSAIAQSLGEVGKYQRSSEQRQMARKTARNQQQLSAMQLQEYMANAPMRKFQSELQMQQLEI